MSSTQDVNAHQDGYAAAGEMHGVATMPSGPCVLHMCTDFKRGGIQRHVLDLAEWLRHKGYKVKFAGTPAEWMNRDQDAEFIELQLDRVSTETGHLPGRLLYLMLCSAKLRAVLQKQSIDLIHAHETAPALVARLATLGMHIPIVYTYHGSLPERVQQVGFVARTTANRVVTLSRQAAKDLQKYGHVPEDRLRELGLGIEQAPPVDSARSNELRRELLGTDGRRLVVMVARLAPQKGIDILIQAARRVVDTDPSIRFVVVGEGPQAQEATAWASQAGVESHVKFAGYSDEPHLYLAAGDMFLLTSRWEALPITIVEALRQGLPVVATDCGGVKEIVDERVGRVVPIGDAATIAKGILDICTDDALRTRLSEAALARSQEDRFSPNFINEKLHEIYAELIHTSLPM